MECTESQPSTRVRFKMQLRCGMALGHSRAIYMESPDIRRSLFRSVSFYISRQVEQKPSTHTDAILDQMPMHPPSAFFAALTGNKTDENLTLPRFYTSVQHSSPILSPQNVLLQFQLMAISKIAVKCCQR